MNGRHRSPAGWALSTAGALTLLLAGAIPVSAAASGAPGLRALHPNPEGFFEYQLSPGARHVDSAVVSNASDAPGDFLVYADDGYTAHVGGVVYGERAEPLRPAGAEGAGNAAGPWISPSQSHLHLAGREAVTISITTTVPAGTPPGDYVGGVVAENPTPFAVSGGGGGGLNVTQRSVVAVVVRVPGPTHPGWSIGAPAVHVENGRRQVIEVPLASTGDLLAKPTLGGTLATCAGSTVERFTRPLDTFLPHSRILYPLNVDDRVLPAGCYRLSLDFGEPGGGAVHAEQTVTITDPQAQVPHFVVPNAASEPTLAPAPSTSGPSPLVIGLTGGVGLLLLGNLLALLLRRRRPPVAAGSDSDPTG